MVEANGGGPLVMQVRRGEEVVLACNEGEITVRVMDDRSRHTIAIRAPKDVKISRRKVTGGDHVGGNR